MPNLGQKTSQREKFRVKIDILGTCDLFCQKFAAVFQNSVRYLLCLLENCNFLPKLLFQPTMLLVVLVDLIISSSSQSTT